MLVEAACLVKTEDVLISLLQNSGKTFEMDKWLIEKLLNFKTTCSFVCRWLLQQQTENRTTTIEKKTYMVLLMKLAQFEDFQLVFSFYSAFKSIIEMNSVVLIILAKAQAKGYRTEDPMILFHKVSSLSFSPDPAVVIGLFDSCYSEGNLRGALEIAHYLKESGNHIPPSHQFK